MRKITFLNLRICFLLLIIPAVSTAQDYQPMAVEGAHWIVATDLMQTLWIDQKYSFTVRGDTIVNEKNYKKVYREVFEFNDNTKQFTNKIINSDLYALMRDDTLQRKVFAITETLFYDHNCPENEEYLLFDFSLEQGDTLTWCSLDNRRLHPDSVSTVDSIRFIQPFFSDAPRKTIYTVFGTTLYNDGTVIETAIPIIEGFGYAHTGPFLEGNFLIDYCIGTNATCDLLSNSTEPVRPNLKIFPNPAKDLLIIEFGKASDPITQNVVCQIISSTGMTVKQQRLQGSQNKVPVSELPNGLYLVRLTENNEIIYQGYVVKL